MIFKYIFAAVSSWHKTTCGVCVAGGGFSKLNSPLTAAQRPDVFPNALRWGRAFFCRRFTYLREKHVMFRPAVDPVPVFDLVWAGVGFTLTFGHRTVNLPGTKTLCANLPSERAEAYVVMTMQLDWNRFIWNQPQKVIHEINWQKRQLRTFFL